MVVELMTLLVCWLVFPLVLVAAAAGCGLAVEAAAGRRLPGALVVPVGLAAVIVVAGLVTMASFSARSATPLVVVVALAGWVLAVRARRLRRPDWWGVAVGVGVFVVFGAPVLLSGEATLLGYIKLDDTTTWLSLSDWVMSHGRGVPALPVSSFELNLRFYLEKTGYPIGSFLPLGVGHNLTGEDVAWLFQPYLSLLAATLGLVLYEAISGLVQLRWLRSTAAWVAAQPALFVAYAWWGGVKEIAAAMLVALVAVLVVPVAVSEVRLRPAVPLAVAVGALLGVLGIGAGPWVAPLLLAGVGLAAYRRRADVRSLGRPAGWLALTIALLGLPALVVAPGFIRGGLPTYTGAGFSALYANLYGPLNPFEMVGIWPSGDFRTDPAPLLVTVALIAIAVASAVAGVIWLARRAAWAPLVYLVAAVVGAVVVEVLASPWLAAKAFATGAPAVLLAATLGAVWLVQSRWRAAGIAVAVLVAGGVVWSNVLGYGQVSLAPRSRLAELQTVAHRIAGQGPTLITEPEIYSDRHFLRDAAPEVATDYRPRPDALTGGARLLSGSFADLDSYAPASLSPYRTLVLRRSPVESRPPATFERTWTGRWYEVWQRPAGGSLTLLRHAAAGDNVRFPYCGAAFVGDRKVVLPRCGRQPAGILPCPIVSEMAAAAGQAHGRLLVLPRTNPIVTELARFSVPQAWAFYPASGYLYPRGAGTATGTVVVPRTARYVVWLSGSFARGFDVALDGRPIGDARYSLGRPGQYTPMRTLSLTAGSHTISFHYGGADLHPGSAEGKDYLGPIVLEPEGAADQHTIFLAPAHARQLCSRSVDWIEVVTGI